MMTMSDDGDRTCPLCAEEMDITDQQLKPCKCGYEICVWCWHHIIDMAEKEDTEGRCPACRTRYDKDRIVKMAATCERTVTDKNTEKKQKTQKVKSKALTVEAKKHLASVRVIQRNLVYIIGLPANLCNESVLERREYFGQYGKVLKVSVSRPTGAPSQQTSTNNGISVYITYAKEEEAIRCIQAVHNFVLEGKVLRACFGTTKYCHAWLRNMTCGNPDCLYLHDVGSQEDSFTKDEIISAYTRSRVPQMASTVSQRRSGTVLPSPADDFSYSAVVSAKHTIKNGTSNTTGQSRLSPPNSSSGRSTLPPATSWGHRELNTRTPATEVTSSQSLIKSKSETHSNSFPSSSMIPSARLPSSWNDDTSTVPKMTEGRHLSERDSLSKTLKLYRPGIAKETQAVTSLESSLDIDFSTIPSAWNDDEVVASDEPLKGSEKKQVVNGQLVSSPSLKPTESSQPASKLLTSPKKDTTLNISKQSLLDCVSRSAISNSDVKSGDGDHQVINMGATTLRAMNSQPNQTASESRPVDTEVEKLSVGVSSVTLDSKDKVQSMAEKQQLDAILDTSVVIPSSQNLNKEPSHSKLAEFLSSGNKDPALSCQSSADKHLDWSSELQSHGVTSRLDDIWNSSVATDKPHARMLDTADQALSSSYVRTANTPHMSLWNDKEINRTSTSDRTSSTMTQTGLSSSTDNTSAFLNLRQEGLGTMYAPGMVSEHSGLRSHQHGVLDAVRTGNIGSFGKAVGGNKDEGSIISDILSLEFDPWDESYSTANNFAKMLNESEKNDVLFNGPSWKSKGSSNESRFSFARQDNQRNFPDSSFRNCGSEQNFSLLSQNSHGNVYQNGIAFQSPEEDFPKSNPLTMSDMPTAGTSRSKISAPPGFSAPARVPPPGFSSQDGLNPPPGFSSGFSSQDMLNTHGFSSGFSSQAGSNPPLGFSSQAGSNPPRGFNSGFSSQDGSNIPPGFSSAFSAGFSSQNGSNQAYGSTYSETRLLDNLFGSHTNQYQPQISRHTSDIEFIDPAILAVGKGRMPGVGDSGLDMKNAPFPAQLQTSNNDPRLQLLMQQSMPSHQNLRYTDHVQDAFNPMNDNYLASRLLQQNHGSLSPYAQMPLQQPRNSQLANGHWDGWSDLRQGNNVPMSDMSRMLYPSEASNFHMLGSNDMYNRTYGL
ncbi:hypothetical protein BRADI_4g45240v3 [Brachypodium distachyon]|uniref:RING-type domain-containing protein n=2 Tax=Brachypodium distachyon TaxID=15368 RepID=A0A0Q3F2F3_BRADI|nr:hypothetical protein BRADI_4g45240v3 [Brachypodium distachyon]